MAPRIYDEFSTIAAVRFLRVIAMLLLLQPACHIGRQKAATSQFVSSPIRIAFLPLNVPQDDAELTWLAMAVPVMMAGIAGNARDLDVVPFWESIPIALEVTGPSRVITSEMAATIAARLSVKWATQGELASAKNGIFLTEDFIPAGTGQIPFRYEKQFKITSLQESLQEAVRQFLRYQVARQLTTSKGSSFELSDLRRIAEAVDREYGWFSAAEPGKADKVMVDLSHQDDRLAGLLFSPTLYAGIGPFRAASGQQSVSSKKPPASNDSSIDLPATAPTAPAAAISSPPTDPVKAELVLAKPEPNDVSSAESGLKAATPEVSERPKQKPPIQIPVTAQQPAGIGDTATPPPESSVTSPPPTIPHAERKALASNTSANSSASTSKVRNASSESGQTHHAIQVFSSRSRRNSEALAEKLEKAGLKVEISEADLKEKGIWFRIRLTGYQSVAEAEAAASHLLDEGLITQYWIVR